MAVSHMTHAMCFVSARSSLTYQARVPRDLAAIHMPHTMCFVSARSSLTRQASVPRDLGSKALVWGVTGEQQWSIELTTGKKKNIGKYYILLPALL